MLRPSPPLLPSVSVLCDISSSLATCCSPSRPRQSSQTLQTKRIRSDNGHELPKDLLHELCRLSDFVMASEYNTLLLKAGVLSHIKVRCLWR